MGRPTVAIIGASADRVKYGNKSLRAHLRAGYRAFAVNPNADEVEGMPAYRSLDDLPVDRLDRVTVYVQPEVLLGLLETIARKSPAEVWLNPSTTTPEVVARSEALGLNVIRACSLIDAQSSSRFRDG